jgi:hypothetical protein
VDSSRALVYAGAQTEPDDARRVLQPMSSNGDDITWAFVGAGFGALSFFRGFRLLRNKRLIENTPTSKCRSLAMGFVEVAGQAAGDTTMPSLVGRIPCYCSHVKVERYEKRSKSSSWVKVHDETRGVVFRIQDDTGSVKVDPTAAELDVPCDFEYATDSGLSTLTGLTLQRMHEVNVASAAIPSQFAAYCASRGVSLRGRMRFFEHNVCPRDTVYVLGSAEELRGVADEQERLVIRKGKHHPCFLIAESSEKALLSKYRWRTALHIFGGGALSLFCLGYLLYKLGWLR